MIRALPFLLCLFAAPAWATDVYFDSSQTDPDEDGSEEHPFNAIADHTIATNDTLYLRAGTTYAPFSVSNSVSGVTVRTWPSDPAKCVIRGNPHYPVEHLEACAIIDCAGASIGITNTSSDEFTVQDVLIRNCDNNGIFTTAANTTAFDSYYTRVAVWDTITQTSGGNSKAGSCFLTEGHASSLPGVIRVTYTDTIARRCASHGYDSESDTFADYWYGASYDAGQGQFGAHGFTSHARLSSLSDAWTKSGSDSVTSDSGTRARRNVIVSADDEQMLCGTGSDVPTQCLVKIDCSGGVDGDTPNVGEWCLIASGTQGCSNGAGCFLADFGVDVSSYYQTGEQIRVSRTNSRARFYYTTAARTRSAPGTGAEGHGHVSDDLTQNSVFVGTLSIDNEGDGYSCLYCSNSTWEGAAALNNGDSGFSFNVANSPSVASSTAVGNGSVGFTIIDAKTRTPTWRGLLSAHNRQNYNVQSSAVAGLTQSNNLSYDTVVANANFTPAITSDPLLMDDTSPRIAVGSAAWRAAGTVCGVDFRGRTRTPPCSIGAYEPGGGDPIMLPRALRN